MAEGRHFASDNKQKIQVPKPVVSMPRQRPNRPSVPVASGASTRNNNSPVRRRIPTRIVVACALAAALGVAGIAGVVAWLTAESSVQNQFVLGEVKPVVNEEDNAGDEFENDSSTVKQDVSVSNEGNVPIYVRAKFEIYWVDANGNQLWEKPEPEPDEMPTGIIAGDYRLSLGEVNGVSETGTWLEGTDGYYYWSIPLSAEDGDQTTGFLIEKLERINALLHKDGRRLVCDVSVQAIQADPASAVEEAWGVVVSDNGVLTVQAEGE